MQSVVSGSPQTEQLGTPEQIWPHRSWTICNGGPFASQPAPRERIAVGLVRSTLSD
jgi:hypothetical protein